MRVSRYEIRKIFCTIKSSINVPCLHPFAEPHTRLVLDNLITICECVYHCGNLLVILFFRSQTCSFAVPTKSAQSKAQEKQDFVHACAVRATRRGIFSGYVRGRFEENEAGKRVKPVRKTG